MAKKLNLNEQVESKKSLPSSDVPGKSQSKKWYGRFWPPERKKVKLLQVVADSMQPEIQKQLDEALQDYMVQRDLINDLAKRK